MNEDNSWLQDVVDVARAVELPSSILGTARARIGDDAPEAHILCAKGKHFSWNSAAGPTPLAVINSLLRASSLLQARGWREVTA